MSGDYYRVFLWQIQPGIVAVRFTAGKRRRATKCRTTSAAPA